MTNLAITPRYLEELLAPRQANAARSAEHSANSTNIKHETSLSWGLLFWNVHNAMAEAESSRIKALSKTGNMCNQNAEKLRIAASMYTECDARIADNLNNQIANADTQPEPI